jgi:hypothetical protein
MHRNHTTMAIFFQNFAWTIETLGFDVEGHVKLELKSKVNMLVIECLFHEVPNFITKDAMLH